MMNHNIKLVTLAVGLALSAPSMSANLSAAEYEAAEKTISSNFTTAKTACAPMSGNAGEICLVIAEGKETIARADLEVKNESTPDTRLQAQIARAEAAFAEAKERCDDEMETSKSACVDTAKTVEAAARDKADKARETDLAMTSTSTEPRSTMALGKNELRADDTLFDFDSAALRPAGRTSLDEFIGKLKSGSSAQVAVVAYADRLGSAAYNQRLSEKRMEVVKSYLVDKGIQASRISAEAMGQAQPTLDANDCAGERSAEVIACLQPDRRVVVSTTELVSSR